MTSPTLAQDNVILQPPEPIAFDSWREVGRQEFYTDYQLTFPSAYDSGVEINDIVKLKITFPSDPVGKVPVVVLLHYWGASDTRLEDNLAARLANSGIASVLVPLPYHLSRTPEGKRSGEMAIKADIDLLKATMEQSIQDIRRAIDWIESKPEFDHERIGLSGTSLGALIGALAFAVDDRITASNYLLGGADLAHILWNSSKVVKQRDELRKQGFTESKVREALADVEPLNYLDPNDQRPSFVIAARHDTVIPPIDSKKLEAALGNSQSLWLDTGHYGGILVQSKIVRTVSRFFDGTFRETGFTAPQTFYTPTIRWGLQLNDSSGLQVMAGLDVWRLRADGQTFATAMLTPRGLQAFVGHTVSKNLAFGFSVLPQKTTVGALWSIVL